MRRPSRTAWLLLLTAITLWAADFWQSKPFADWSEKEIRRVLTNSPWAREVRVRIPAGGSSFGTVPEATARASSGRPGSDFGDPAASATLTVRWQSALPVKQALVKNRYGEGAGAPGKGKEFLDREEEFYIVTVSGFPRGVAGLVENTERLKQQSALKRKNKEDLLPQAVDLQRAGEFIDVNLLFPRTNAISLDDKNVELMMDLGRIKVRRRFKLQDMVFREELQL